MSNKIYRLLKKINFKQLFLGSWLAGLFLVIIILITYHLAYFQKIYPFVQVAGVEIGNQTHTQAVQLINNHLAENQPNNINLISSDKNYHLSLTELGLKYLPEKTVDQAYQIGRSADLSTNLAAKYQAWTQGQKLDLDYQLNWFGLEEQVASIAAQLDISSQLPEAKLINGQIEISPGKNGQQVDQELILKQIDRDLAQIKSPQINIPITQLDISLTPAEAAAFKTKAEKFVGQTVSWQTEDQEGSFSDQEILPLLTAAGFNQDKLNNLIELLAQRINREPINAVFEFTNNKVETFKASQTGLKLDKQKAYQQFLNQLENIETGQEISVIDLPVITSQPEIKTADINNLGIKELVGKGESTFFHSIASRVHNVQLTAEKINGSLIKPGETFSFNQTLGEVSRQTGYQSAYVIKDGRTILGDGGGVCQISTTLFRAVLDAGLPVIERRAHSYRVGYYEQNSQPGFDATVYDPHPDLQFKNDTGHHLLLQTYVDIKRLYLAISLYGTGDGREVKISNARVWDQSPPPEPQYIDEPSLPAGTTKQIDWAAWGAKAAFDWQVTRGDEILQDKTFYSVYRPWQAIYLRGTQ